MKENATHIRLIQDGKPVEAEYENPYTDDTSRYKFNLWAIGNRIPVTGDWPEDKHVFAMEEVELVDQYSKSDIPVWIDCDNFNTRTWAIRCGYRVRVALRLKATLSSHKGQQVTNVIISVAKEEPCDECGLCSYSYFTDGSRIQRHLYGCSKNPVNQGRGEVITFYNASGQSEVTVKEGEKEYICSDCHTVNLKKDNGEILVGQCENCEHPLWNPKQEATTAEGISSVTGEKFTLIKSPVIDPLREKWVENIYQTSFKNMGEAVVWIFENVHNPYVSLMELAKQQYQQEMIEKLEAEIKHGDLQKNAPAIFGAFKRAIQIIQSTK